MNDLYTSLAEVYDGMYRTFINYEEELNLYGEILKANHCTQVLEIGCGTGNLASMLIENGFQYTGLDLSDAMLAIARRNLPLGEFVKGNMRDFNLLKKFEAAIITGRTLSYLVSNKDVYNSFVNFNKHLTGKGIICFDCINASKFIPSIKKDEKVIHRASFDGRTFVRESFWNINFNQSWSFDWLSIYFEDCDGELKKIGEDKSTIRAFVKEEIALFLNLTGFEVKEIRDRPSYAFDTFVVVAQANR
ncbi:MAG: methyltransferase domain-containing protein [Bacteroidetes bacterium]|nr:methyltransferase domain-containing protein [Bacteroidota bacterium]